MDANSGWSLPEALQELPCEVAATLVGHLIKPFQTDVAVRLQRTRKAIAEADPAALRAEVHSLKGSASQVGADVMASICAEMESSIGQVPVAQLLESVGRLEVHCTAAVRAMSTYSAAGENL